MLVLIVVGLRAVSSVSNRAISPYIPRRGSIGLDQGSRQNWAGGEVEARAESRRSAICGSTPHRIGVFDRGTSRRRDVYLLLGGTVLRRVVYVEMHRGHLSARVPGQPVRVNRECADLSHPRTLFGKFMPIQEAIASALSELEAIRFGVIKPRGIIHLIPHFDGGYTDIELRAFREAAEAAGIFRPLLLDSKTSPLSDVQVKEVFR